MYGVTWCKEMEYYMAQETQKSEAMLDIVDLRVYFASKVSGIFHKKYIKAVDGVTLHIKRNQVVGLVGESGCGKSTLGRTIVLLERPTSGHIYFKGRDILHFNHKELREFRKHVQMIFQDPFAALNPLQNVYENLSFPLRIHGIKEKEAIEKLCFNVLKDVKLSPEYLDKYPHQLSGGERQRVCIARAMILNPELLIADEPTSMIDASIKGEICKLLSDLKEKHGLTILLISHDLSMVEALCEQIAVMYLGKIVEVLPVKQHAKYMHPYSQLLAYASDFSIEDEKILSFKGEIPSALNPPKGCRFHPRCIYAFDRCEKEEPLLKELEERHIVACFRFY